MKYLTSAKNSFLSLLTYRANFLISLISRAIQLGLAFLMWAAIYQNTADTVIQGYTASQMFKYLLLTALLSFIFTFAPVFKLASSIKTGRLNTLLLRPISINHDSLAIFLGSSSPFILLVLVFMTISQTHIVMTLCLIGYFILSLIVWHELMFIIGTLAFWLVQIWPLRPIINGLYLLFGGLLFPLDILPPFIYQLFRFFPISLVSSDFVELIVKEEQSLQLMVVYSVALIGWYLVLKVCANFLFKKGLKKFEGVGL
ncbi:ABC-2 family transporter protein [Holzapfeliella sp. He02]|uniref:ABC-2 family transporter protein n=1 Tax=Holzapfeliella saturejae TaxID=3082953 RepID=A0ABU8SI41_9LACO